MNFLIGIAVLLLPVFASAQSAWEGLYQIEDGSKQVRLSQFGTALTMNTTSFYPGGERVDWFFEFILPADSHATNTGETLQGRVRSADGFYNCLFDEPAFAQREKNGGIKVHFPVLTYHRETDFARDWPSGEYYQRSVDWNGWEWVETGYHFPIERWREVSSKCIVDQSNWTTETLIPLPASGAGAKAPNKLL